MWHICIWCKFDFMSRVENCCFLFPILWRYKNITFTLSHGTVTEDASMWWVQRVTRWDRGFIEAFSVLDQGCTFAVCLRLCCSLLHLLKQLPGSFFPCDKPRCWGDSPLMNIGIIISFTLRGFQNLCCTWHIFDFSSCFQRALVSSA